MYKGKCKTCTYWIHKWCAILNETKFSWSSCSKHQTPQECQEQIVEERTVDFIESKDW